MGFTPTEVCRCCFPAEFMLLLFKREDVDASFPRGGGGGGVVRPVFFVTLRHDYAAYAAEMDKSRMIVVLLAELTLGRAAAGFRRRDCCCVAFRCAVAFVEDFDAAAAMLYGA